MRLVDLSFFMPGGELQNQAGTKQVPGDFAGLMQALLASPGVSSGYANGMVIPVSPGEVPLSDIADGAGGGKPSRGGGEYADPAGIWPPIIPGYAGVNLLNNLPAGARQPAADPLPIIPGGGLAGTPALPVTGPESAAIAAGIARVERRENMSFCFLPDTVEPSAVAVQAGIQAPEQFPGEPLAVMPVERPVAIQQSFLPARNTISPLPAGNLSAENCTLPVARNMPEPSKTTFSMSGTGETLSVNLSQTGSDMAVSQAVPDMPAGSGMLKSEQSAYSVAPAGLELTRGGTVRESVVQPVPPDVSEGRATRTEQNFSEPPGHKDTGVTDEQLELYRPDGPLRLETAHHSSPRPVRPVGIHELIPLLQSQLPVWAVRAAAGRGFTTRLQLHPAGLGELQVEVQLSGQQTSVHFVTASAEVKDVLQAALPQLREALQQHNLQLSGTSVTLADGQQGLAQQFSGHYGTGDGRRRFGSPSAVPPGREEHTEAENPRILPGGLDRLV